MAKMNVMFGQLTKPLDRIRVHEGVSIEKFCEDRGLTYSSAIRVNGRTVGRKAALHANDIITSIENIDGGQ